MYPVDMRYHEMMFTMTWPPVIESWFVDAMVYGIWVTTCYHASMDCKFATIENVVSWWNQLKSIFLGAELHNNIYIYIVDMFSMTLLIGWRSKWQSCTAGDYPILIKIGLIWCNCTLCAPIFGHLRCMISGNMCVFFQVQYHQRS